MKTLHTILALALMSISTCITAQTRPPSPPEPPVPSRTTTEVTSSSVSVITQSGDYGKGGNTSFSVSNSDDEYRLKSRYPENRFPAIKKYLVQELGTKGMQSSGNAMVWSLEGDEDTVYEVELDDTKLKIELDKTLASPILISKFEDMGDVLSTLISGGDERQKILRLERDAARAQREAERMQREAKRLQESFERDAARLEKEAEKLEREAERLSLVSKRGGGIDGYVREILSKPSTIYDVTSASTNGWKWPLMQKILLNELNKDGFIKASEDVVFIKERSGMYINGDKLSPEMWSKYNGLFRANDYGNIGELSFYKQAGHVAVVSSDTNFDRILDIVSKKGLFSKSSKITTIQINGSSVFINDKKLSQLETEEWNTLLHKEKVIPAPGKTIKLGENFASMGYSFGKNTLGIWTSR